MKKYNLLYVKRTALWIFSIFGAISVVFFAIALIYDELEYDLLIPVIILLVGAVFWLISLVKIPFAVKLLNKQLKELSVPFKPKSAARTRPSSLIFLSDNWFVISHPFAMR